MNLDENVVENYINTVIIENKISEVSFKNLEKFHFAYDIIDKIAEINPKKIAILHIDENKIEKSINYKELKNCSNRMANFSAAQGIKKGDAVLIALRRAYQFWYIFLGLIKIGAIPIPVVSQLREVDIKARINISNAKAIISLYGEDFQKETDKVINECVNTTILRFSIRGGNKNWINIDKENEKFSNDLVKPQDYNAMDIMFILFTSGTSGTPKMVVHDNLYPLAHYITGKYWNNIEQDKLHLTISDTGWGKALWGKLFGPWLSGGCVFVYDFRKFEGSDILHMIEKYKINTICMPPTMYRMLLRSEIKKYDLSSITCACSAGEILPKDIINRFYLLTGIKIANGYGQSETGLLIADLKKRKCNTGSIGYPNPIYKIELMKNTGEIITSEEIGEVGEIVIDCRKKIPIGLASYLQVSEKKETSHIINGYYHTNDLAYRDAMGAYWYIGRNDTLIKSSGYKINPYEIESVLANLNYIRECKVYGVVDEIRGNIIKADIVLSEEKVGTEELKKEIQDFVKTTTAPYKYPRKIEFVSAIEKTMTGKIVRN